MARKNQFSPRQYTNTTASCSKCKSMKSFSEFSKDKGYPRGIGYWCKICANINAKIHHRLRVNDPEIKWKYSSRYIKSRYGISYEQYIEKLADQLFECAICGTFLGWKTGSNVHLDHDHKTNKLRDFLCGHCNRGLGSFFDDPKRLDNAIAYLERHQCSL